MTAPSPTTSRNAAPTEHGVRITTGARLHFGLLDTVAPFGGCGVMIDGAETEISVTKADSLLIIGGHEERIRGIANRIQQHLGLKHLPACRIEIHRSAPAHSGLGSGTQLSLAATEGILRVMGEDACDPDTIIAMSNRGRRSAVGVHGYFHGGFIAEGLHPSEQALHPSEQTLGALNPMNQRVEMPEQWRAVVLIPAQPIPSIAGQLETDCFSQIAPPARSTRTRLATQLEKEVLPMATKGQFLAFTDAITHYNHDSGMLFSTVQGGPYNGEPVHQLIQRARDLGAHGIGQSSWGPGVFAWFENPESADEFVQRAPEGTQHCLVARVRNRPRQISELATS